MSVDLTAGIVRIRGSHGATVSTGLVVTNYGLIATCTIPFVTSAYLENLLS
ncbi:MAG: hypothetical protein ACE5NP_08030 [Anaerolineae bacterium]